MASRQSRSGLLLAAGIALAGGAGPAAELVLVDEWKLSLLLEGQALERLDHELEASGVVTREGAALVVFDNTDQIARIPFADSGPPPATKLIGRHRRGGYEGVTYDPATGRVFAVVEAEQAPDGLRGCVRSFEPDLERIRGCEELDYNLQADNKGFEGLSLVRRDGTRFLLALCEGNECDRGSVGRTAGGGRIKVFEEDGEDGWEYAHSIRLPASLDFEDYSGMEVVDDRLVVVSQQSSALWLGELDSDAWTVRGEGAISTFPRLNGELVYCNVEGVSWLPSSGPDAPARVVVVSDRRKDDQPASCETKDQSLHVFELPP